ncbi:tetratricopeptide repeat protein [Candidatus Laterigemmans baculatus]|uniref:tetratricopeptide repeat protein n=1 Tax=Candidatus Laterigemmans baculatus TaxID=2770505 RepID=UPI0013DBDB0F|nr:tetratricopeptide repeat protein [Candidatus Laterigemmans baculatus]
MVERGTSWRSVRTVTSQVRSRAARVTRGFAIVAILLTGSTLADAGLIPMLDSATARQGAAQLSAEQLRFADEAQPGFAELEAAVNAFREGKIDEAQEQLTAAASVNDQLPPPTVMLSRMFFATGQVRGGRQLLEQAAIEHADHPDVYLALGDLGLVEGRVTDAALQYEKALSLLHVASPAMSQKAVDAKSGLAAVAERRQHWELAEKRLAECVELAAQNASFKQRLARVLFEQQRYEEAATALAEAMQIDSKMQLPALIMGHWHHVAGNAAEAEDWMQKALEEAPEAPSTLVAAAVWCLESDRPRDAQKHLEQLAKVQSDAPQLLHLQGIAAMDLGDYEAAERCFQTLTTEHLGDFASSNRLVLALIEQPSEPKQRRALQIAELNTRQYPNSPESQATLGWVCYRLGNLDTAERIFEPLLAAGVLSPDATYYAAKLLVDRERTDEAGQLLSGALAGSQRFRNRSACQSLLESLPGHAEKAENAENVQGP